MPLLFAVCVCVCALPETRDPEHKYRKASKKTARAPARARGLLRKVGVDGKRAADRGGSGRGGGAGTRMIKNRVLGWRTVCSNHPAANRAKSHNL